MNANIKQVLSNPDGTLSTKRVHSFIALFVAIVMAFGTFILQWFEKGYDVTLIIGLVGMLLGYAAGCLGFTSYDHKQWLNAPPPTPTNEPDGVPSNP